MGSEKPTGADNQQGSRRCLPWDILSTPQRLHAELLAIGAKGLEAYLQGALRDGTRSARHNTHRIGQREREWLVLLQTMLRILGHRAWIYPEGRDRRLWVVETGAPFLSLKFDGAPLVGHPSGLHYVRGYFDAEGGMPWDSRSRLYIQFCQKDRQSLQCVHRILEQSGIDCGLIHNPSSEVDPHYWRFYVRARGHERFLTDVGSWHPRKRQQIATRMKI